MISYAQNFEDVMLWRALKHVKNGFYIDVGAWSPDLDSVTRYFYENGWSGINIEPNPEFHAQCLTRREKDINLKVAISDIIGEIDIYFCTNPGLSSLDKYIVEQHKEIGWDTIPSKTLVTTIKNVCQEYCQNKDIHFLKIDVEGYEKRVLLGNDWSLFRPWIVVVEATLPMSQVENYEDWEYILLESDYTFAYADGLNRFYVAKEHSELLEAFKYPPNVFDGFVLANQVKAEQNANEANTRAAQAEQAANEANARATQAEQAAAEANTRAEQAEQAAAEANLRATQAEQNANKAWQNYYAVINSKSWKITKPLRKIWGFFHKMTMKILYNLLPYLLKIVSGIRNKTGLICYNIARKIVLKIYILFPQNSKFTFFIIKVLKHFPRLDRIIRNLIDGKPLFSSPDTIVSGGNHNVPDEIKTSPRYSDLSPRAKEIYKKLKKAIEEKKSGGDK